MSTKMIKKAGAGMAILAALSLPASAQQEGWWGGNNSGGAAAAAADPQTAINTANIAALTAQSPVFVDNGDGTGTLDVDGAAGPTAPVTFLIGDPIDAANVAYVPTAPLVGTDVQAVMDEVAAFIAANGADSQIITSADGTVAITATTDANGQIDYDVIVDTAALAQPVATAIAADAVAAQTLAAALASTDPANRITIGTDGLLSLDPASLVSTDAGNQIVVGTDGNLIVPAGAVDADPNADSFASATGSIANAGDGDALDLDVVLSTDVGNTLTFGTDGGVLNVGGTNIYTDDGALTGNRTMDMAGSNLTIDGTGGAELVTVGADLFVQSDTFVTMTAQGSVLALDDDGITLNFPATGDLEINTDPGTAGQVLTSQGDNLAPVWGSALAPITLADTTANADHTQDFAGFNQTWNNMSGIDWNINAGQFDLDVVDALANLHVESSFNPAEFGEVSINAGNVIIDAGSSSAFGINPQMQVGTFQTYLGAGNGGADDDVQFLIQNGGVGSALGVAQLHLKTVDVDNGTATAGQVLTLMTPGTGEAEWQDLPVGGAGDTIYTADGVLTGTRSVDLGGALNTLNFTNGFGVNINNTDEFNAIVNTGVALRTNGNQTNLLLNAAGMRWDFDATDDLEVDGDPGLANQVLTSNGPDLPPTWSTVPAGDNIYTENGVIDDALRLVQQGTSTFIQVGDPGASYLLGIGNVAADQAALAIDQNAIQFQFSGNSALLITDNDTGGTPDPGVAGEVLKSRGPGEAPEWGAVTATGIAGGQAQGLNCDGTTRSATITLSAVMPDTSYAATATASAPNQLTDFIQVSNKTLTTVDVVYLCNTVPMAPGTASFDVVVVDF